MAKKIIKASKTAPWRSFVATVNNRTSLKTIWNVVRKGKYRRIKGVNAYMCVKVLEICTAIIHHIIVGTDAHS